MKRKAIYLLLLQALLLTACTAPTPPKTGSPAGRQPGTRVPRPPEVEPKPEQPSNEDPVLRVYRFNPTQRPGRSFLTEKGALGWDETFAHGFPLPSEDVSSLRKALSGQYEVATEKDFRPQFAIVMFDRKKNPLRCIEVCRNNKRAQVQDAGSGTRQELVDASQPVAVIETHLTELLAR